MTRRKARDAYALTDNEITVIADLLEHAWNWDPNIRMKANRDEIEIRELFRSEAVRIRNNGGGTVPR